MKKHIVVVVAFALSVSLVFAAAKYAAPAIPNGKNGIMVIFENGNDQYKLTRNQNNTLRVEYKCEYNYDNAFTFVDAAMTPSYVAEAPEPDGKPVIILLVGDYYALENMAVPGKMDYDHTSSGVPGGVVLSLFSRVKIRQGQNEPEILIDLVNVNTPATNQNDD